MPEDVFATLMPTVLSAGQQGVQNAQQQQNWFQEQQAKAKQVPIEDLARQIKMKELQNEFKNSGNIAALLKQMGQQPGAQQGQTGQQGQQATDPMQAYQNIAQQYQKSAQFTQNVWGMATDPRNPKNLLDSPEALLQLKEQLKTGMEFAKDAMSTSLSGNIGRMPVPLALVDGKYVPLDQAPTGSKHVKNMTFDDKGQPKLTEPEKEEKPEKQTMEERTYTAWLKDNLLTKDTRTGKMRPSNENDYKEYEKLLAQQEKQAVKDAENHAVAQEIISGNMDIGPANLRNAGVIKQIHDIDPYFNPKLAHAQLTSDTAELTSIKKVRGNLEAYENTALASLGKVNEFSKEVDRTGTPVLNRWILGGMKSIKGDTKVADFDAAMNTFAGEYAKVMSGSTGSGVASTDSAREEIRRVINTAFTQGQITSLSDLFKYEMKARRDSLDSQIKITEDRIGGKKAPVDLSKVDWGSFEIKK